MITMGKNICPGCGYNAASAMPLCAREGCPRRDGPPLSRGAQPTRLTSLTRDEAVAFSVAINKSREALIATIKAARRKRSWGASELAMALAGYEQRLKALSDLNECLCEHYGIGGY